MAAQLNAAFGDEALRHGAALCCSSAGVRRPDGGAHGDGSAALRIAMPRQESAQLLRILGSGLASACVLQLCGVL
eukprot:4206170-Pleurochrysis_carterae.AAC.3